MIRMLVNLDGLDEAMRSLVAAGRETTPLMRDLGQLMREATQDAFEEERDPVTGAKWAPLSPAYRRQRMEAGHDGKILQLSGELATSITLQYGNGFARVGTNRPHAAAHQFGARTRAHVIRARFKHSLRFMGSGGKPVFRREVSHPGSVIPARPFLGVGEAEREEMRELVARHLKQIFI